MSYKILTCILLATGLTLFLAAQREENKLPAGPGQEPFDVTRHNVPIGEIQSGGPVKDGIPALTDPRFVSAQEADRFLSPEDRVLGVERSGVSKAYPIKILNWHEVVNDTVAGDPLLVSW